MKMADMVYSAGFEARLRARIPFSEFYQTGAALGQESTPEDLTHSGNLADLAIHAALQPILAVLGSRAADRRTAAKAFSFLKT